MASLHGLQTRPGPGSAAGRGRRVDFAGTRSLGSGAWIGCVGRPPADAADRVPCSQQAQNTSGVHGTATLESSASTTRSASMPSASASKLSNTRCRSTSWAIA